MTTVLWFVTPEEQRTDSVVSEPSTQVSDFNNIAINSPNAKQQKIEAGRGAIVAEKVETHHHNNGPAGASTNHVPHQLPAPVGDFVGREEDIETLVGAIRNGGVLISALRGMGGVGKTQLAIAREINDRHGVGSALGGLGNAYCSLATTTAPSNPT